MDILSHGLWGGVVFGRSNPKKYWSAFLFGIAPDALSFGLLFTQNILGFGVRPDFSGGPPDPSTIPAYIHALYNTPHSIVIGAPVIGIVWFPRHMFSGEQVRKKLPFVMLAWPFHILVDIPTHGAAFFPTPFLWPLADLRVNGIPWSNPWVWFPNLMLLALAYGAWWLHRKRTRGT